MKPFEYIVPDGYEGARVDNVIAKLDDDFSYIFLQKLFRTHNIKVNDKKVKNDHRVQTGDIIKVYAEKLLEKTKKNSEEYDKKSVAQFQKMVIFENENFLAINKPTNLAVQLGSRVNFCVETLAQEYRKYKKYECCKLVHRIDKDTSGILLIAKNQKFTRKLTELFRENKIKKTYIAIVDGKIKKPGLIDNKIAAIKERMAVSDSGQRAITHYRPLEMLSADSEFQYYSVLELKPQTGRKHQLRVHCAESLKAPILGDKKYNRHAKHDVLFLHAYKINIESLNLEITAPIPEYFPHFR